MRALRVSEFGPASVLRVEAVAPPQLQTGGLLVDVHAAAVTPLDTYLRSGISVGEYTPRPPYTPGGALAGVVSQIDPQVRRFRIGDRVYGRALSGSNAEVALCAEHEVHTLPTRIAFADGALAAVPFETAYYSLFDLAKLRGGETVLVQGAAGSVGAAGRSDRSRRRCAGDRHRAPE